jgi:hypothetical protein
MDRAHGTAGAGGCHGGRPLHDRGRANSFAGARPKKPVAQAAPTVDQRPLQTARKLALLASPPEECESFV